MIRVNAPSVFSQLFPLTERRTQKRPIW